MEYSIGRNIFLAEILKCLRKLYIFLARLKRKEDAMLRISLICFPFDSLRFLIYINHFSPDAVLHSLICVDINATDIFMLPALP